MTRAMPRVLSGALSWADPRRRPLLGGLVLGLAHAVTGGLAFPPFDAWALVLVATLPLMVLVALTSGPTRSALGVWIASAPVVWWQHSWVGEVSSLGLPAMILYLSMYPAAFVWLGARVRERWGWVPLWVLGPVLWAGLEVVKGEAVFTGYPWFLLAHPMIAWDRFAMASAHVGVYALSACVVLPGAVLCVLLLDGWKTSRFGAIVMLFVGVLIPMAPGPQQEDRQVRVIVVQTAVPQSNKAAWSLEQRAEDFVRAMRLSMRAQERWPDADLLVWPETMFPGVTLTPDALERVRERLQTPFADDVLSFSSREFADLPWLIGGIGYDGYDIVEDDAVAGGLREESDAMYNSVFLVERGAVVGRYDKRRLAPFGEVLPYFNLWPWLEKRVLALGARGMSFNLDSGTDPTVLETRRGLRVATPICFEAVASDVCRDLVFGADGARRADLLVNGSNDGWFGVHPGGRSMHLLSARWRSVELRTPMVRAANTGISVGVGSRGQLITGTFIDEGGAIVAPFGGRDAWGALLVEMPLGEGDQPGTVAWVLTPLLGVVPVIGVVGLILPRRKAERARPEARGPAYDDTTPPDA